MNPSITHFNVRVYGLVLNPSGHLLLSDEYCQNRYMTKFPGGGLEPGEGLIDGLKREFLEECNTEIEVLSHFYTTDFFVQSMFRGGGQLISVYYLCRFIEEPKFTIIENAFEGLPEINDSLAFRWVSIHQLDEQHLTWPVDRVVVDKLKKHLGA